MLGEYPGVVGGAVAVWDKCSAPRTAGALAYAFRCDSGRYIDPTDGTPREQPPRCCVAAERAPAEELCV